MRELYPVLSYPIQPKYILSSHPKQRQRMRKMKKKQWRKIANRAQISHIPYMSKTAHTTAANAVTTVAPPADLAPELSISIGVLKKVGS